MVNYTPLGGTSTGGTGLAGSNGLPTDPMSNVNPAMNASALIGNNVQLINMLDGQPSIIGGGNATVSGDPAAGAGAGTGTAAAGADAGGMAMMGTLEQMAMADNNWLEGIPGGMFDWGAFLSLFESPFEP